MSGELRERANPLSSAALALPDGYGKAVSIAARLAGSLLAVYVAVDQSYNRTQVLALGLAIIALLSLAPVQGRAGRWLTGFGASVLFFGGALLWSMTAGMLMLVAGAVAAVAGLMHDHRSDEPPADGVSAFFVGSGAVAAGVLAILFAVEG